MFLARRLSENLRRRVGDASSLVKLIISVKCPLSKERNALAPRTAVMSEVYGVVLGQTTSC
jgi:uncharacterized membrane protein YqgA involved in biofilm formation